MGSDKEILITHSDQLAMPRQTNFSPTFIVEPSSQSVKADRGSLYLLQDCSASFVPLANMIKRIFEFEYYKHTPKDSALVCLEATMSLANRKIQGFTQTHGKQADFYSVICAVLVEKTLHLMQIGSNSIFLLRKGSLKKISNVSSSNQLYFSNIATGSMSIGDTLILANQALLEATPIKRLKQLIASNYPSTAVAEIKTFLNSQADITAPVSLVLVELNTPDDGKTRYAGEDPSLRHMNKDLSQQSAASDPIKIQPAIPDDELEELEPPTQGPGMQARKTRTDDIHESDAKDKDSLPTKESRKSVYGVDKNADTLGELGKWKSSQPTPSSDRQEIPTPKHLPPRSLDDEISQLSKELEDEYAMENEDSPPTSHPEKASIEYFGGEKPTPPEYKPKIDFTNLYPKISYTPLDRIKDSLKDTFGKIFQASKSVRGKLPPQELLSKNVDMLRGKISATGFKDRLGSVDLKEKFSPNLSSFKDVKVQKKHLFLVLGILTAVLVSLMLLASWKQQQNAQYVQAKLKTLTTQYDHAIVAIESNDIPEAKKSLKLAGDIAKDILSKDKQQKEARTTLNNILERLDKIDGIVRIENVEKLGDIATVDKADHAPISLLLSASAVYILDPKSDRLYSYNHTNKKMTLRFQAPTQAKGMKFADILDDVIYIYSQGNAVSSFATATDSWKSLSVSLGGAWTDANQLSVFDENIYLVDSKADQIWRFRRMGNEFSPASRVFERETISLNGLVDLGIDGDVYILKQSGALIRSTQTQQPDTSFSLSGITPSLGKPIALFLDSNKQADIYIADSTDDGMRIVVVNKNGLFKRQYVLPEGTPSLKDLVVDFGKEKVYFLAGTALYAFSLTK